MFAFCYNKILPGILTALLFFTLKVDAQRWEWVAQIDGPGSEKITAIEKSGDGHFYIAGTFNDRLTYGDTTIAPVGMKDIFLAKTDTLGNVVWLRGEGTRYYDDCTDLVTDQEGNVFISGYGYYGGMISKYDSKGHLLWSKNSGDSLSNMHEMTDCYYKMALDNNGDLYTTELNYSSYTRLIKMEGESGNKIWKKDLGRAFYARDVKVLDNNLYVSGYDVYHGGPWEEKAGHQILLKYDLQGNRLWRNNYVNSIDKYEPKLTMNQHSNYFLDVTPDGKIVHTGNYLGNIIVDGGTINARDGIGLYLIKTDTNQTNEWYNSVSSSEKITPKNVVLDSKSNAYICGYFKDSAFFESATLTSSGADMFIAGYDENGTNLWAKQAGNGEGDLAYDMLKRGNNIYVVGRTVGMASFDDTTLQTEGNGGGFIARLSLYPPNPSPIEGPDTTCLGESTYRVADQPFADFEWSTGENDFDWQARDSELVARFTSPGEYEIRVTAVNDHGSSQTDTLKIRVKERPNPDYVEDYTIHGKSPVCQGKEIYSIPDIENGVYAWELSGGGSLVKTDNFAIVDWKISGKHTLTVVPENECGVGDTLAMEVKVHPEPDITAGIEGPAEICRQAKATYSIPSKDGVQYLWYLGDSLYATGQDTISVSWDHTGSDALTVIPKNVCGTGPADTLPVKIKDVPGPVTHVLGDKSPCLVKATYGAAALPTGTYCNWLIPGNASFLNHDSSSVTIAWQDAGAAQLGVIPSNQCGMGDTSYFEMQVNDVPVSTNSIMGMDSVCQGDSVAYNLEQKDALSYRWYLNNEKLGLNERLHVRLDTPGINTIETRPVNGCGEGKGLLYHTWVKSPPKSPVNIIGKKETCFGETEVYQINDLPENGQWHWTDNPQAGELFTASHGEAIISWNQHGTHQLQVSVSNSCGSSEPKQQSIRVDTVAPKPIIHHKRDTLFCEQPADQYIWFFNDEPVQQDTLAFIIPGKTGKYRLQLQNKCGLGPVSDAVRIGDETTGDLGIRIRPNPTTGGAVQVFKPVNLVINRIEFYSLLGTPLGVHRGYRETLLLPAGFKGVLIVKFHTSMGKVVKQVVML